MVDGDTELLPGVTLIETSGHAPGHQSVLVRLPKTGAVLLVIDAVGRARHAQKPICYCALVLAETSSRP